MYFDLKIFRTFSTPSIGNKTALRFKQIVDFLFTIGYKILVGGRFVPKLLYFLDKLRRLWCEKQTQFATKI